MKYYRSEIVKQAQAWIGKNEKDDSHKEIIDIYNTHEPLARCYKLSYNEPWCSAFISALAIKCGYTEIIPTEVSCYYHIELFKKLGCWVENDNYIPKAGDVIFYDWEDTFCGDNTGSPNHVGIIEKVEGNTIHVIDGNNVNQAVGRRTVAIDGNFIRGFGVPKYTADKPEEGENMKFKIGDKVVLNGELYYSPDAEKSTGKITDKVTEITRIAVGTKHPYNTTGDLGWIDECDIKLYQEPTKDYKELYEKELLKNKDLQTQIDNINKKINDAINVLK